MLWPRKSKFVCAECGTEHAQVTAWVDVNTRREEGDSAPVPFVYCPTCDTDAAELREVQLSPAERAVVLTEWRRRALVAVEAMVVAALDVLGVETASHLVANAMTPYLSDPDDADLPDPIDALIGVVERDRSHRAANPGYPHAYPDDVRRLLVELDILWVRAHRGEHVTPDALDRLREAVDLEPHKRALRVLRSRGFWHVLAEAPEGRVIARAAHPMLAVAAVLCAREVPSSWRDRA